MELLPVTEHSWENMTVDLITYLPKSDGYGTIIVVMDIFFNYVTFMLNSPGCIAKEVAKLFFKNMVRHWGLPSRIISD